jgi:FtsP/CotA-like multicopper oxidase with cupredoxin domain
MNTTVFGATGGIGKDRVAQALTRGHSITAVVRDPIRLAIRDPARTDNPGTWMLHCHNTYHQEAGMMTSLNYTT